jgi:hypothetical protein
MFHLDKIIGTIDYLQKVIYIYNYMTDKTIYNGDMFDYLNELSRYSQTYKNKIDNCIDFKQFLNMMYNLNEIFKYEYRNAFHITRKHEYVPLLSDMLLDEPCEETDEVLYEFWVNFKKKFLYDILKHDENINSRSNCSA